MPHLEIDPFLNELNKLYDKTHTKSGTVWLTFKAKPSRPKKAAKDEKKPTGKDEKTTEEPACLVRATDGKVKFSTTVKAKDTVRFHLALSTIMKAHMDSLKKRDKSKKPKTKRTASTV